MLLQANDYLWLHRPRGRASCRSAARTSGATSSSGVDLIRRAAGDTVHALAWPLLTARRRHEARQDHRGPGLARSGRGPARTSSSSTGWRPTTARCGSILAQFTLLPVPEIDEVVAAHADAPERREAQRVLARAVTALVHGRRRRPGPRRRRARRSSAGRSPVCRPRALDAVLRRGARRGGDDGGAGRRARPGRGPRPHRPGGVEERGPARARAGGRVRERRAGRRARPRVRHAEDPPVRPGYRDPTGQTLPGSSSCRLRLTLARGSPVGLHFASEGRSTAVSETIGTTTASHHDLRHVPDRAALPSGRAGRSLKTEQRTKKRVRATARCFGIAQWFE